MEIRKTEIELNKAENFIRHKDEINSKPRKYGRA